MKLIISHTAPDFDALASMALAQLIHPGAKAARLGRLGIQLETFMQLYRDEFELLNADKLNLSAIEELIIVDTSDPLRIAPFDTLLDKIPVTLYDHHPRPDKAIPAIHGIHREVGATATILTSLLKSQGIKIPQTLASLALLGIHDDTGNLTYKLTQPEDHEAAAHLLHEGASLNLLQRFIHEHYSEIHRELFAHMLEQSEQVNVLNHSVVLSFIQTKTYVQGLAPLCNQLLRFFNSDAAFIIALSEKKTLIIGRSTGAFNVASLLNRTFGGGGHPGAGFAQTDLPLADVRSQILNNLPKFGRAPILASSIMNSPVATLNATSSIAQAKNLLLRLEHNGFPVINNKGDLVGIISKRDVDKALQHKMGHVPVKSLMAKKLVTATEDTPLNELEDLLKKYNIGRIPILKGITLTGIVTRSDLIRARYQTSLSTLRPSQEKAQSLLASLPHATSDVLAIAQSQMTQGNLYLVGGTVRDLALNVTIRDLDLSVEGLEAEELGKHLQQVLGGSLSFHSKFSTCKLQLENDLTIDIATARNEYYRYSGALPEIKPSSLHSDIERRDFSINALAIRLNDPVDFIDLFNGLDDLESKTLRILHPLSFIEDPTRIIRGAKLAGRLSLNFESETLKHLSEALKHQVVKTIAKSRLKNELELIFQELRVAPGLIELEKIGALKVFFNMKANPSVLQQLDTLRYTTEVPKSSYLLALLLTVPQKDLKDTLKQYQWPKYYLDSVKRLKTIHQMDNLSREQFKQLSKSELAVIRSFSKNLETQIFEFQEILKDPIVRGQDILRLGLPSGPEVGEVLEKLAHARHLGEVTTFDEELNLAKTLISQIKNDHSK